MTYVVAWEFRGTAFLVADSAVTNRRDQPRSSQSTFGEAHVEERGRVVEESAFKIFRWHNIALGCAGDADAIRDFAARVAEYLLKGWLPWAAVIAARKECKTLTFEGVALVRFLMKSRLLRIDARGECRFVQNEMALHIGSPPRHLKELVNTTLFDGRRAGKTPEVQLACVLAACQSLTVQQSLLQTGAGGAFSGVMLDRRGTRWQPDIAYVVLDPGKFSTQPAEEVPSSNQALYVASVIREDVLIVHSSVQRGAVGFLSGLNLKVDAALEARLKRVFAASREKWLSCSFDYVVLISTMFPFTGVIEMNGKSENSGLKLAYRESGANPKALVVQLAQHVADALRGMSDRPQVPTIYFYSEATD